MSTKAYIDPATAAIVQPMIDSRDKRIAELEQQLAELRDVSAKVITTTRGSGGINPNAVEALRELQILLEDDQQEAPRIKQDWQAAWEKRHE